MFGSHNRVFLFSLLYVHACYVFLCLKEKYAENMKSKKNQNAFTYGCKGVFRRCESYMMYLKGDDPYQISYDFLILLYHYFHMMRHLCFLVKVSHKTQTFSTLDTIVQVQCDLAITRNTCGCISLLNCLNLFLKIKLVKLVQCLWIQECFASRVFDVFECLTCLFDVWYGVYLACIHIVLVLP